MTITATETGIKITGSPQVSISSVVITDDNDVESTLDMSDISSDGLESIYGVTDYKMSLDGIFNGFSAFVDLNLTPADLIKNVITVDCGFNDNSRAVNINGAWYQGSDGLIKIELDGGETNPSELTEVTFGLFTLSGSEPLVSADLLNGVTTDNQFIYVVIDADELSMFGKHYIGITVNNGAKTHLASGYITIEKSRL